MSDPLSPVVVTAYRLGSPPVPGDGLVDFLRPRFLGQSGGTWADSGARAAPHHGFQVFEVHPWLSLLRRTGAPSALTVLDRCRIRTGTVRRILSDTEAVVRHPPLTWTDGALAFGPPTDETVHWAPSLLPHVAPGASVTLHWNWICDLATETDSALSHESHSPWVATT
ncbi:DUF6390 family protein [Actinoplanes sp. NPDC051851]|uniref:DUF6390 family protein n=1 Tax=Actinoplanes sp. NPDC051851 TaxID=3154753 RepID=UPI00342F826A